MEYNTHTYTCFDLHLLELALEIDLIYEIQASSRLSASILIGMLLLLSGISVSHRGLTDSHYFQVDIYSH
jgi:hypothetical protein